jgi:hypothetical protein
MLLDELIHQGLIKEAASLLASRRVSDSVELLERLDWSKGRALFLHLCGEDARHATLALTALRAPRSLQLWCELLLRSVESDRWRSVEAALSKELESLSSHIVERACRSAYTIFAKGKTSIEHCISVDCETGFRVSASTTSFPDATAARKTEHISFNDQPLSYRVELGEEEAITASFAEKQVAWRVKIAGGVIEKSITLSDDVSILDNFVWHHFGLLLERSGRAQSDHQRLSTFVPSTGREVVADLRYCGRRQIKPDLIKTADYYQVTLADKVLVELWADEKKRPLIIQVESQGLYAVSDNLQSLSPGLT